MLDIEKLSNSNNFDIKEYCIIPALYKPILSDGIDELINRIKEQQHLFPKAMEVFLNILNKNCTKHFLLEDWLVIIPYQFIWQRDKKSLLWFENIFNELANSSLGAWDAWCKEILQECKTPNDICDRIYSYLLHLYAGVYFVRKGFSGIKFPPKQDNIDIIAYFNEKPFAIECKFIRTSKKI